MYSLKSESEVLLSSWKQNNKDHVVQTLIYSRDPQLISTFKNLLKRELGKSDMKHFDKMLQMARKEEQRRQG